MDMTIRVYRGASDGTRTETVPEYRVDGTAEPNRKPGYLRTCACPMHKGGPINPPVNGPDAPWATVASSSRSPGGRRTP
ncbi:hypothetical protein GCM10009654_36400 [Streptomyces hebeiensis]|uniref:Uncharacterized protein n=1 Tax=Streptomyces hebeiensis TaxID=229486 RepID=A0ABN1UYA1_9ACTN